MDEVFDGQQLLSLTPYYPSSASLRSASSPQGEGFAAGNLRPKGEALGIYWQMPVIRGYLLCINANEDSGFSA